MFLISFVATGLRLEGRKKSGSGFASAVARSGKFCALISVAVGKHKEWLCSQGKCSDCGL